MSIYLLVVIISPLLYILVFSSVLQNNPTIKLLFKCIPFTLSLSLMIYLILLNRPDFLYGFRFHWLGIRDNGISLGLFADGISVFFSVILSFWFMMIVFLGWDSGDEKKRQANFTIILLSMVMASSAAMLFSPSYFQMFIFLFLSTTLLTFDMYLSGKGKRTDSDLIPGFIFISDLMMAAGLFSLPGKVIFAEFPLEHTQFQSSVSMLIIVVALFLKISAVIFPVAFSRGMNLQRYRAGAVIFPLLGWVLLFRLLPLMSSNLILVSIAIGIIVSVFCLLFSFYANNLSETFLWLNSFLAVCGAITFFLSAGKFIFPYAVTFVSFQMLAFFIPPEGDLKEDLSVQGVFKGRVPFFSIEGISITVIFLSVTGFPFTAGGLLAAYISGQSIFAITLRSVFSILYLFLMVIFSSNVFRIYFNIIEFGRPSEEYSQHNLKPAAPFLVSLIILNGYLFYTYPGFFPSVSGGWLEKQISAFSFYPDSDMRTGMAIMGCLIVLVGVTSYLRYMIKPDFLVRITNSCGMILRRMRIDSAGEDYIFIILKKFFHAGKKAVCFFDSQREVVLSVPKTFFVRVKNITCKTDSSLFHSLSQIRELLYRASSFVDMFQVRDLQFYLLLSLGVIIMIMLIQII